ncbi:transcription initiation factor TFIID subunit 8 [Neocloeon triangulifer]|uniref:transcription initiation factor TFIID subunit 8 n=1 Tax=Neocloeon triangulifer TaxID=2078957 RepID=UPI00286F8F3B|nr:transcription initiation factor TFIID subunit 8 [Neocloeon triangulifer]
MAEHRIVLSVSLGAILTEAGFDSVEKVAFETLLEILSSFLISTGNTSRNYCELAGRVQPVAGDLVMTFADLGIDLRGVEKYARRQQRLVLPALSNAAPPKPITILQAGTKLQHPSHIPDHLPAFPDPHAYIRTPTHKQPVTEYEALREKAAAQKRDIERALTKFVAKTGDTQSLFMTDDVNIFPLVACKPQAQPYLDALVPKDQVFDEEDEELEPQPSVKRVKREDPNVSKTTDKDSDGEDSTPPSSPGMDQVEQPREAAREPAREASFSEDPIDNPYLRAVKKPHKLM